MSLIVRGLCPFWFVYTRSDIQLQSQRGKKSEREWHKMTKANICSMEFSFSCFIVTQKAITFSRNVYSSVDIFEKRILVVVDATKRFSHVSFGQFEQSKKKHSFTLPYWFCRLCTITTAFFVVRAFLSTFPMVFCHRCLFNCFYLDRLKCSNTVYHPEQECYKTRKSQDREKVTNNQWIAMGKAKATNRCDVCILWWHKTKRKIEFVHTQTRYGVNNICNSSVGHNFFVDDFDERQNENQKEKKSSNGFCSCPFLVAAFSIILFVYKDRWQKYKQTCFPKAFFLARNVSSGLWEEKKSGENISIAIKKNTLRKHVSFSFALTKQFLFFRFISSFCSIAVTIWFAISVFFFRCSSGRRHFFLALLLFLWHCRLSSMRLRRS